MLAETMKRRSGAVPTAESHHPPSHQPLFDRDAFHKLAQSALSELRQEVLKHQHSHELSELQMFGIWRLSLLSFRDHVLAVLLAQFPGLANAFSPAKAARSLCTLENLTTLVKEHGATELARAFGEYFSSRATMRWSVLVKAEYLRFQDGFAPPSAKDESTALRQLTDDEKEGFRYQSATYDHLDAFYFVATVEAGDPARAVEKARAKIEQFIAPYYLHRMLNPDRWWRARTVRGILSPVSFYYSSDSKIGMHRELHQLITDAGDLFNPMPSIKQNWKAGVESLVGTWHERKTDFPELERRLRLCARWMFAAETEEDTENSFLKHCVAWEALLPKTRTPRRSWYLLLLSAGSSDPLCIVTVSQGERLIDRRNGFAHPENTGGLCGSVEGDLYVLKQSLRYAFDSALRAREMPNRTGDQPYQWEELLSRTFDLLCAKSPQPTTDNAVLAFLSDLRLLNPDPYPESTDLLSEAGHIVRAEALAVKGRECWENDPCASVRHLARGYCAATRRAPPYTRLHLALWLRRRLAFMNEETFKKAWSASGVGIPAPLANDLKVAVEEIHRDHGLRPEYVGWRE